MESWFGSTMRDTVTKMKIKEILKELYERTDDVYFDNDGEEYNDYEIQGLHEQLAGLIVLLKNAEWLERECEPGDQYQINAMLR